MVVQSYESLFICPAGLPAEEIEVLIEKAKQIITQNGGLILSADKWGRRKLAYPIKKHREGFYLYLKFESPTTLIKSLEHFFRMTEEVIRHIIVRLNEKPGSKEQIVVTERTVEAVVPETLPQESLNKKEEVKENG